MFISRIPLVPCMLCIPQVLIIPQKQLLIAWTTTFLDLVSMVTWLFWLNFTHSTVSPTTGLVGSKRIKILEQSNDFNVIKIIQIQYRALENKGTYTFVFTVYLKCCTDFKNELLASKQKSSCKHISSNERFLNLIETLPSSINTLTN